MTDILDLPGWVLTGKRNDGAVETFEAEYVHEARACEKCGSVSFYRHGTKKTTYTDSPLRGFTAKLEATVRRYRCKDCSETFLQPLGGVLDERRMTERCAKFIAHAALKHTFVHVAREVGVDEGTVRSVAAERMAELQASHAPRLPRVLGVDETKIHRVQRLVLTDIEARRLVDMYPKRDDGALEIWLSQFGARDLAAVQVVTMDMWRPYQRTVRKMIPHAAIVVDKFHVVRYASDALEEVRIRLGKGRDIEVKRFWVRSKIQLNKRPHNLSAKQKFNLDMWLDNEPELAEAYRLKETLYNIYDMPKERAKEAFNAFTASVPASLKKDFGELTRLMKNWREEMLAYFDHRISNGYTEALNGVAKVINRSGRGYSFEVLRARLLFKNRDHGQPRAELGELMSRSTPRHEMLLEMLGNRCQSCQGVFEGWMLFAHNVPTVAPGEKPRRMYLCPNCHRRFHMESARGHHSGSTQ